MTHSEFLAQSRRTVTMLEGTDILPSVITVTIVTDTASIMNYGKDGYGQSTSYDARQSGGVPTSTGTDAENVAVPPQTATTASPTESAAEDLATSKTVFIVETTSVPKTVSGGVTDAQATGLQVLAAIAFGGLVVVGAM